MKIHCKYDELVDPKTLKNHPKNRNKHGQDQIDRIAEMYEFYGVRKPIEISKQTGLIVAGHGRKLAAIRAGIKEFPVVYQDFESEEQEYGYVQADNAIALWAELDLSGIKSDVGEFKNFNIKMLGIQDFDLELSRLDGSNNGTEDKYTKKINAPVYEPKKDVPPEISELFSLEKYNELIQEIKNTELSKEVKAFLTYAAARHIVFNYENIAEFYCHQSKEVQNLMENSALVIIDFDKAIENGFVKLTDELQKISENNEADDE